jgi:hypothetical protein
MTGVIIRFKRIRSVPVVAVPARKGENGSALCTSADADHLCAFFNRNCDVGPYDTCTNRDVVFIRAEAEK